MTHVDAYHLQIGEMLISAEPVVVTTVLGSCVSVFLFSPSLGVGGVIHYAHPRWLGGRGKALAPDEELRYGDQAIVLLIEELCTLAGCRPEQLQAKVVGGANQKRLAGSEIAMGASNLAIAERLLAQYRIKVIGSHVAGNAGRKVFFYIPTGRMLVATLDQEAAAPGRPRLPTRADPSPAAPTPRVQRAASALPTREKASGLSSRRPPSGQPTPAATLKSGARLAKSGSGKRKVLIIDDSKTICNILTSIIASDANLEVVGTAHNPIAALPMIERLRPDVLTLDIHMPEMDGLTFLEKHLPTFRLPTVMISSISTEESQTVLRALELGAVDYIQKPSLSDMKEAGEMICQKIKAASAARLRISAASLARKPLASAEKIDLTKIIAIGASTGGTEAIRTVLSGMPSNIPPIVIVQHIPPIFSAAFARRLDDELPFHVKEAEDGDWVEKGKVLIAPGGLHMAITKVSGGYKVRLSNQAKVSGHKPSVDVLFESVAAQVGRKAIGVLLTGMGNDGAAGLLRMREAGAQTIAQDEESSVVFGMPREAIRLGAAGSVCHLEKVAGSIVKLLKPLGKTA